MGAELSNLSNACTQNRNGPKERYQRPTGGASDERKRGLKPVIKAVFLVSSPAPKTGDSPHRILSLPRQLTEKPSLMKLLQPFVKKSREETYADFVSAIRAYDWVTASKLAQTDLQQQDVKNSMERVEEMLRLKAEGRFSAALKLAILVSEIDAISKAKRETPGLLCCCMVMPPKPGNFNSEFVDAMRANDWSLADKLVTTLEERHDLGCNKLRVKEMLKLKSEGK